MKLLRASVLAAGLAVFQAQIAWAAPPPPPKLIVAISVDQFSADLFSEYRGLFTGGLKRLQAGVVFPSGYQSHASTETCPGHSTILTGSRPARTGIIANNWVDLTLGRADKAVYCVEDPSAPGTTSTNYVVSDRFLRVPTLGDRLKAASPDSRSVAVAGKDRAAVTMGGHDTDELWFWGGTGFVTLRSRTGPPPAIIAPINARVAAAVAVDHKALLPGRCATYSAPVPVPRVGRSVGELPVRGAGDFSAFRAESEFDRLTADLAIGLIRDMKLGQGQAVDVLAIGLSATDYVGHRYGNAGAEMCAQMLALDATIGRILTALDGVGAPYLVTLTADHGGLDIAERHVNRGMPEAQRLDSGFTMDSLNVALRAEFGLSGSALLGDWIFSDVYLSADVPAGLRPRVIASVKARLLAHPQVAAVFTHEDLRGLPMARPPVDDWTLAERFRASFDPERSGELMVALKPGVSPISNPSSTLATHGSPWGYDRRVPMLFYWPDATGFEQPLSVETVDILPTLAALVGLRVPTAEIDGRCLDLDAGPASTCPP